MQLSVRTEDGTMDVNVKRSLRCWHVDKSGEVTFRAVYFVSVVAENVTKDMTGLSDEYVTKNVKEYVEKIVGESYRATSERDVDALSLLGKYHKKFGDKKEPEKTSLRLDVTVKRSDA